MANNDSIQYALSRIDILNSVIRQLVSTAKSGITQLGELNSSISDVEKKAILIDGLEGLNVSAPELKTKMDSLQAVCLHVINNVEELSK